jgi:hypothetical protein
MKTPLLLLLASALLLPLTAHAGDPAHGQHAGCGVCCPTVKVEQVEDFCWEVRSKEICIPPVQFPWQKQAGHKGKGDGCCPEPSQHCGKTRCVKFLWQQPVEKEECVYEWNVVYPGKDKCNTSVEIETLPDDGEVPAPPPVNAARRPATVRMQILQR